MARVRSTMRIRSHPLLPTSIRPAISMRNPYARCAPERCACGPHSTAARTAGIRRAAAFDQRGSPTTSLVPATLERQHIRHQIVHLFGSERAPVATVHDTVLKTVGEIRIRVGD